jgi:hypothetical protein
MALEEAVIGSLVGVVGGFLLGFFSQNWNIKRNRHEMTKERVHSPLFDEVEEILEQLKQNDVPWTTNQWFKITREQHLSYLVEPAELDKRVRKFYDETISSLTTQVTGSRNVYGELVKRDLMTKVTQTGTPPAINEVTKGVGWNMYKGEVWFGDSPNFNQNYNSLVPHSSQLPATFQEYFDS